MTEHCFISYSNRDAEEFGPQLSLELEGEHPYIETWYDKKNIPAGKKWDEVISKAIGDSKCFLFVVTRDSIVEDSICMRELSLALSYKKPIFPLCLQSDVEFPWLIRDFQRIDFCGNHKKGMAQLKLAIQRIDSPAGQLDALQVRLSAAERDFDNPKNEAERLRAQFDIEKLNEQIKRQKEIVKNPRGVERSTDLAIAQGIEQERKAEPTIVVQGKTTVINPNQIFVPAYFQGRFDETQQIADFLKDDTRCLFTIIGRGGVGKTILVGRVLKYLEKGSLPDNLGSLHVNGIVYLRETSGHDINFSSLFNALSKFLAPEKAGKAEAAFREARTTTEVKMRALLDLFDEGRYVVLLDNFDTLVDLETQNILDAELDSALRTLLTHSGQALKIVITTRNPPHQLNLYQPGRQQVQQMKKGLPSPYAENLLRALDGDGRFGLKTASAELLDRARELTNGFPRALEALYGILATDRSASLAELLSMPLPEDVVEALIGEAFNRLDATSQKTLQALAVYNRLIPIVAVDHLLQKVFPGVHSAPILDHLVSMHFVRREAGRYSLHPSDQKYAFELLPLSFAAAKKQGTDINTAKYWNRKFLLQQAADYFLRIRKPSTEWKSLEDLSANLIEYEFRLAAEEYDKAAEAISEATDDHLWIWGYYRRIIDLQEPLSGKLRETFNIFRHKNSLGGAYLKSGLVKQAIAQFEAIPNIPGAATRTNALAVTFSNLGICYLQLGDYHRAITNFNKALPLARKIKDRRGEDTTIGNLGNTYYALGEVNKAIEFHKQALVISREIGNRSSEGSNLCNLGNAYAQLGEINKGIEFYEQALVTAREVSNRSGEGIYLGNLGNSYAQLGEVNKAIVFYEQALVIAREIGDRSGECYALGSYGVALIELNDFPNALDKLNASISIADEINRMDSQSGALLGLAQVYLFQKDLANARATIEAALQYDVPSNNHHVSALHGIIALRQGEEVTARGAFVRAIGQADEILSKTAEYYEALDAKGLALCGLAIANGGRKTEDGGKIIAEAVETFQKARKIAPHAGIVKSVLRMFDELAKCDPDGILNEVRAAAAGKE